MFDRLPHERDGVRLRRLRLSDLPDFHACRSDASVARYQGWNPMTEAQALAFLREQVALVRHAPDTWAQIGIAGASDDRLIGDIGVWLAPAQDTVEIGLSIASRFQQKGSGGSAIAALFEVLLGDARIMRIIATVDARNLPCIRLLERAGMRYGETRQAEFKDGICDEHTYIIGRGAR